jgi:para-nitrobenzyl esterase
MAQNGGWGYGPGIDGYFLERPVADSYADGEQANIPLLAGWTSSELGMSIALNPERPTLDSFRKELRKTFGKRADDALGVYPAGNEAELLQSAADLASDLFISFATWKWIETHSATSGAPVYRYRFDRTIPGDPASEFGPCTPTTSSTASTRSTRSHPAGSQPTTPSQQRWPRPLQTSFSPATRTARAYPIGRSSADQAR